MSLVSFLAGLGIALSTGCQTAPSDLRAEARTQAADEGLVRIDPRDYIKESPADIEYVRRLVRFFNQEQGPVPTIPSGRALPAELQRLGRPAIPLLWDEVKSSGLGRTPNRIHLGSDLRDALLVPLVLPTLVREAKELKITRLNSEIFEPSDAWMDVPANAAFYYVVHIVRAHGRDAVPALVLNLDSESETVRLLALDLLKNLIYNDDVEDEIRKALGAEELWKRPPAESIKRIKAWWEENHVRLRWDKWAFQFRK